MCNQRELAGDPWLSQSPPALAEQSAKQLGEGGGCWMCSTALSDMKVPGFDLSSTTCEQVHRAASGHGKRSQHHELLGRCKCKPQ